MSGPSDLLRLCPIYRETPLFEVVIDGLSVLVKDESQRMGLGSFKALGGIYAVARLLEAATGITLSAPQDLDRLRAAAGAQAFVCASAGNHGLAVATGARLFGARATVVLADPVPEGFAHRLRDRGATVLRRGATYEDSVAAAIDLAEETGAIHLADSSWPGYTEPPRLVMEGYSVLAAEMQARFETSGDWPDVVYLQAGVGGLAGAVARDIRANWAVQPRIIVVEPEAAACLKQSAAEGAIVTAGGPVSSMGRLDCKTPSMLAFDILRSAADRFVTVTDAQAEAAAGCLGDAGHATTPSGAAGLAALLADRTLGKRPLIILSEGAVA
ncbi:pyridoxal-phosphate dependent enzyme [Pseudooceanicola sp. C21-150M6]|uniref:pyridoxal-phosphate dependent enzyme n=1 Tax=Pseudooceanicola sp. C21-150M6 TaxID=3434355 RepID=UPI003D7FC7ED